ncbi:MAG: hypothetical protein ACKVII_01395 [Planctomycetales bacterium]
MFTVRTLSIFSQRREVAKIDLPELCVFVRFFLGLRLCRFGNVSEIISRW